jgi:flagellar protein FlgJ
MALTSYSPGQAAQASVFDMSQLSDLKKDVRQDAHSPEAQKKVATQFEALYIQMMLKRMREATPKDSLFDSDQTRMVQSMADEQLALQLATPGIGLGKAILAQMQINQPPSAAQGALAAPAAAPDGSPEANSPMGLLQREMRVQTPFANDASESPEVVALLALMRRNRPGDRDLAASEGAPDHVTDFVSEMAPAAMSAAQASGVPARLILGQAALESGWGKREIRYPDGRSSFNLFGIKAGSGWQGKVVNVMTTEYVDGVPHKMMQPFRAYASYEEAFTDYARLIGDSPRYESVTLARDEIDAAHKIQRAGYATDPRYADKLIGIMGQMRGAKRGANL